MTALNNPGGIAASGLTAAQLNALGLMADDMETKYTAQLAQEAAYRAAVDATAASQSTGVGELRRLGRAANNYHAMTDLLRNAAGLTVRDTEPSPGDLPIIADLAVIGRPNGNNFLDWGTPPGSDGLIWEIFSKLGPTGEWTLVGSSSRTDFLHEGAGAGVHRLYYVRARRGTRVGEAGNEAAVYG